MQSEDEQWLCPSFNSYSSNKLADIAANVSYEVNGGVRFTDERLHRISENDEDNGEDDDGFEFSLGRNDLEASGEEIYFDGRVRPVFPVFNRDLLSNYDMNNREEKNGKGTIKIPLKKLFVQEREGREPPSSSSSEADETETAPPGAFCVWKRKEAEVEQSPSRCKKSNSTGSGLKRWRLRDLLRRSNSDGKDSFVFLTPRMKEEKSDKNEKKSSAGKSKGKAVINTNKAAAATVSAPSSPAHDSFFARHRAIKGNETPKRSPKGNETPSRSPKGNETPKRKSYLPYKRDIVGFFTTVNSIGRTFPPF